MIKFQNNFKSTIINQQLNPNLPSFKSGDTIEISYKIIENKKFRIQKFKGIVLKVQNTNLAKRVTIRKIFNNIAVEKSFLINSPLITNINVIARGKVRRARLYYLRNLFGKNAKIKPLTKKQA